MARHWLRVFFLACAGFLLGAGYAVAQISLSLSPNASYILDVEGRLSIEDIMAAPPDAFRSTRGTDINLGVVPRPSTRIWVKLALPDHQGRSGTSLALSVPEPTLAAAWLYLTADGATRKLNWERGDGVASSNELQSQRYPIFAIRADWLDGRSVYLQIQPNSRMHVPIYLDSASLFLSRYTRETLLFGFLFGVLFIMATYSGALGVSLNDLALKSLAALSFAFLVQASLVKGFHHHFFAAKDYRTIYFIGDFAAKAMYLSFPFMAAVYIFGQAYPRVIKTFFAVFAGLFSLAYCVDLLFVYGLSRPSLRSYAAIFILISLGLVVFTLVMGLVSRRLRQTLLFLACWCPVIVLSVARSFLDFGVAVTDANSVVLVNGVYIAFVVSTAFFAILTSLQARQRAVEAQTALAASERKFRDFAAVASDGYFETNVDGQLTGFVGSDDLRQLFTRDDGQQGFLNLRLVLPRAHLDGQGSARLAEDTPSVFRGIKVPLTDASGQSRMLSLAGCAVEDGNGVVTGYRGAVSDISHQEKIDQQITRQRSLVSLGLLVGSIAHEINNALHPILNLSRLIAQSLPPAAREVGFAKTINQCAEHAHVIVRRVLGHVKNSGGGETAPFSVALERAVEHVRSFMTTHHLVTSLDVRCLTQVGTTEMFQVISNLVANAQMASPAGGRIEINTVILEGQTGAFAVEVRDRGKGMTPEQVRRIVPSSVRVAQEWDAGQSSAGLGLGIVIGIVEGWGGRVIIEAEPDVGTCVRLVFPEAFATAVKG